jgi:hypothetical protein
MATATADTPRDYQLAELEQYPVIATQVIWEGCAVGSNGAGYARKLVAADPFLGFATMVADNLLGAAGDKLVQVKAKGRIKLPIAGLAITSSRPAVYASDDNTFTLTAAGNSKIGWVSRWISTGVAIVEFDAVKV